MRVMRRRHLGESGPCTIPSAPHTAFAIARGGRATRTLSDVKTGSGPGHETRLTSLLATKLEGSANVPASGAASFTACNEATDA